MFRGLFRSRHSVLRIKMPAHRLPTVFHLYREIAVNSAANEEVVAFGPVAIEPHAGQMHRQRVSGCCGLDVKRSGLCISAQHACHALFILSSGITVCSVHPLSCVTAGVRGPRSVLSALYQQDPRNKQQQKQIFAHGLLLAAHSRRVAPPPVSPFLFRLPPPTALDPAELSKMRRIPPTPSVCRKC